MNILHMRYALEVARLGSLNKAAETLLIAQPNISRSIKELESDLGITLFNRSAKGMSLTLEGVEFMRYAEGILEQIDRVERIYRTRSPKKQRFSVSVPRACYISDAFASFSQALGDGPVEIFYEETDSQATLQRVISGAYKLGIVRYAERADREWKELFEEKNLCCEVVSEFRYSLIMSREHPLAQKEQINFSDLSPYIEISHASPYVPSAPFARTVKEELPDNTERRIFVYERASQFDLLSENKETFMWVSPVSQCVLDRFGLVRRSCGENKTVYRDMLIYRDGYRLTKPDKAFITALCESKRKTFS